MSASASAAYIKLAEYHQRCREQAKDLPMQQRARSCPSLQGCDHGHALDHDHGRENGRAHCRRHGRDGRCCSWL